MPFRVYRFTEFEVFRSSTVPFTAHEQGDLGKKNLEIYRRRQNKFRAVHQNKVFK